MQDIFYFSALAAYRLALDPDVTKRHRTYIECLRATGVQVELAKFKTKERRCPLCKKNVIYHEEKETDVAVGVKPMEVFFRDLCDVAVMVTGDSDLAPAVRSAQALFPAKQVYLLSPYKRLSFELKSLCPGRSFRVKSRAYVDHQLPNPFPLADGTMLTKPAKW